MRHRRAMTSSQLTGELTTEMPVYAWLGKEGGSLPGWSRAHGKDEKDETQNHSCRDARRKQPPPTFRRAKVKLQSGPRLRRHTNAIVRPAVWIAMVTRSLCHWLTTHYILPSSIARSVSSSQYRYQAHCPGPTDGFADHPLTAPGQTCRLSWQNLAHLANIRAQ